MKTDRWLMVLVGTLVGLIFALMLSMKKPLCIDSNDIESIYRVTNTKTEKIYKCSARINVPYSKYFAEETDFLKSRTEPLLTYLKNLGPLSQRIRITINDDQPLVFRVRKNQLIIGKKLLNVSGHLERGLIKIWLAERKAESAGLKNYVFTEAVTDFLFHAYKGSFKIEDPLTMMKINFANVKWPQVLTSRDGYCESSWKVSEHYYYCSNKKLSMQIDDDLIAALSLRPLLTTVMIKSYNDLDFEGKIKLLNQFDQYLRSQKLDSAKSIEMVLNEIHPLKKGIMNIKKISDLVSSSALVNSKKEYREFYARFAMGLQQAGVSDSFAEAYFDFIFEYPDELDINSKFFKSLVQTAIKNPNVQIALKDKNQIWVLPSKASLPINSFDMIKSQQHVLMACLDMKTLNVANYFNQSEKLLMIKGCGSSRNIDFESLVQSGVRGFSFKNKKIAFIQFHLPSFEMKANELSHIQNFFELVKSRDVSKKEFQVLGWSQIQWSDDFSAYKPKAAIDAIEYFRDDGTY